MTLLDKYLQQWRIKKALAYIFPRSSLLDIGCHNGELLLMVKERITHGTGIDPLCTPFRPLPHIELVRGIFPDVLQKNQSFDCITALAVLEHIPEQKQLLFMHACNRHLNINGRLIITVPDAKVDKILAVLTSLRLVKGMSLEEHFGFDANSTPQLAEAADFKLLTHQRFQLGLNNLFVFTKYQ